MGKRRCRAAYQRAWRKANPDKIRAIYKRSKNSELLRKYGISTEERDRMLAEQGGVCAGCGSPDSAWKGDWHVDHCHATNVVRGILCHNCNVALGRVHDSPYILRGLTDYLEKHNKKEAA